MYLLYVDVLAHLPASMYKLHSVVFTSELLSNSSKEVPDSLQPKCPANSRQQKPCYSQLGKSLNRTLKLLVAHII